MSPDARLPDTAADPDAPPPVLLAYQQRWVADRAALKIAEKSRRTGLTWAEAADNVLTAAAARSAGGQNVYYIAYNQDMTIEYVQACAMWARAFDYAAGEIESGIWPDEADRDRNIKTFTIRFPSGHRIVALTSRPSNLRGRQGVVVIDEAAFHDQLDELLKAALALLIWGGSVHVISTHNGDDNAFAELIHEVRAGKRGAATVHRIEFQAAVADGLYRRVCQRLGTDWSAAAEADWMAGVYAFYGEAAAEELDVIPASGSGAYLSTVLIEARQVPAPVLRWSCKVAFAALPDATRWRECAEWIDGQLRPALAGLDTQLPHHFGQDFGRDHDLSVIAPVCVTQSLHRQIPFLVELRGVPFRQQEQILFHLVDRLPNFSSAAMDARGNGQALAEYAWQRYGAHRVERVMLSESWYRDHMPALKTAFEDATIALPRDLDVRNDLRALRLVRGVARIPEGYKGSGSDGQPRHADAAIAIALAHYASRKPALPIGGDATGELRSGLAAFGSGLAGPAAPCTDTGYGTVAGLNDFAGWD